MVLEDGVENQLGFLFGGASYQFLRLGRLEADVLRAEDALVVVGRHLEVACERDLVVAVNAVNDAVVDTQTLIDLLVEAHLVEIGNAEQLARGLAGVD